MFNAQCSIRNNLRPFLGSVQIADAVLLARYIGEDAVTVTAQGKRNANCYNSGNDSLTSEDLISLLKLISGSLKDGDMPERG